MKLSMSALRQTDLWAKRDMLFFHPPQCFLFGPLPIFLSPFLSWHDTVNVMCFPELTVFETSAEQRIFPTMAHQTSSTVENQLAGSGWASHLMWNTPSQITPPCHTRAYKQISDPGKCFLIARLAWYYVKLPFTLVTAPQHHVLSPVHPTTVNIC